MAFSDLTSKLLEYLVDKTDAGARVYGGGLPESGLLINDTQENEQLAPTIVAELVPHSLDPDLPVSRPRFRVACYAPDRERTVDLFYQVLNVLHNANLRGSDYALTLWHNGGPNSFIDPGTNYECTDAYYVGIAKG